MDERKVNLLVLMREFPVGMAGTKRILHFLEYLRIQDVLINVISFRSKNAQPSKKGIFNSIPYLNIGAGVDMRLLHIHKILLYYIEGLVAIVHLKKRHCKNIVYNSGGISIENILFIAWAKLLGYRTILAIEEDYAFFKDDIKTISKFKFRTVKRLDFLNCHWANAIVVVSTYLKKKYEDFKAEKVFLIPISAKLNHNENKKVFNNPLMVVYAGSFADKDGVTDLIDGFNSFSNYYKEAKLILVGKSAQQLLYKEKYKNRNNIVFKGFIPDNEYYSLLREADILCMCRTESDFANAGFPFKLGEYLATGNPVICTKVSDVEIYLTENDGYLIQPNSPRQISEALTEIVKNPIEAMKKGLNGLQKCRKHFSPELNGELLFEVIKNV